MSAPSTANVTLIVAATSKTLGIGRAARLPWRLKTDLAFFARVTKRGTPRNAVVMGRKTWESIPARFRPLPERLNVVLTRGSEFTAPEGVLVAGGVDAAVEKLAAVEGGVGRVFVIGGAEIYKAALEAGRVRYVLITRVIEGDGFGCDTFFPVRLEDGGWEKKSWEELCEFVGEEVPRGVQKEGEIEFEFELWEKKTV